MPHAIPLHVAFFYTGIPSYAAALRLGQKYHKDIELRCAGQNSILDQLAELHEQWDKAGKKGLKSLTVLGAVIPKHLEAHSKAHPGKLASLFEEMTSAGVQIFLLNEYAPFNAMQWAGCVLRGGLHAACSSLVKAVEELHDLHKITDPFDLAKLVIEEDRKNDVYMAMLWLDVEIKQFGGKAALLADFIQDLSKSTKLPGKWSARAAMQPRRGQAILVGEIYEQVLEQARLVADSKLPVLILGPSGSGKEALAKRIHFDSARREKALLTESCANFPDNLIESELFGTRKGSFTGSSDKKGLLELAHGGTLFLDELGELSKPAQGKLLRFLQEGSFRPIGGMEEIKVDVRLITATNEDLYARMKEGSFRADLWYRMAGAILQTPALTGLEGWETSIKAIAGHMAVELYQEDETLRNRRKEAGHPLYLEEGQKDALLEYHWPGNARELRQAVHRHLVTKVPMAKVVADLRERELAWKSTNTQYSAETFVVEGLHSAVEVQEDYCRWAEQQNPGLTKEQLGKAVSISETTLRQKIRKSELRHQT